MDSASIAALLEPFLDRPLSPPQLVQLSTYIDLLLRWNARINLTAIRKPEEIVSRHFGESFFLARHLFPAEARHQCLTTNHSSPTVIDIGSGAGFPALPLKIWAPEIHLTLIESNHKKAAFLREVVRSLTLTNVDVIADRAESVLGRLAKTPHETALPHSNPSDPHSGRREESALSPHQEGEHDPADVVTFRAVEQFDKILALAARFLAPHGRMALLIGAGQLPRLNAVPTLKWQAEHIPQSHDSLLAIGAHVRGG